MKKNLLLLPSLFIISIVIGCGNNPVTSPNPNNTDTAFVSYIIVTPTGGVSDTLHFTDRNLCIGSYSSSYNDTYCILNDTTTAQSVSMTFNGNSTGSPAFTFGFLSYMGGSYSATSISGSVSLYEAIGGKIKGTFSGTFTGGSTTYQGIGTFTVKRTQ